MSDSFELFGPREEPRELWEAGRRGGVPSSRYFLLSHDMSTFSITNLSIPTNTLSSTPAINLPNYKPSLPSSSSPFCHPLFKSLQPYPIIFLITSKLSTVQQEMHNIFHTSITYISHIYHPDIYHISPCHPRVPLTPSQPNSQSHFSLATEFLHIPFLSKLFVS